MIKQLIKFSLNHIPRPVLQRIADGPHRGGALLQGRGADAPCAARNTGSSCPTATCSHDPRALCPKCLSLERHRLLWLYLTRETDLLTAFPRTLHIAPEVCIMRHLKPHFKSHPGQYVTADLESPLADLHFDVQQIPLADGSLDVVICNHIMEHVADDRRAMRELHRVLKPGGWGIVLSPVDRDYEQTYEDDSITDPDERTRIFGQYDHRRIYGADYADRLRQAGFQVADIDYAATFTEAERRLYALPADPCMWSRKVRQAAVETAVRRESPDGDPGFGLAVEIASAGHGSAFGEGQRGEIDSLFRGCGSC